MPLPVRSRTVLVLACVVAGSLDLPVVRPAYSQQTVSSRGTLSGTVVDMGSNEPLGLATVVLVPQPAGVLPADLTRSSFLVGARSVRTDNGGRYRFPNVAAGDYRLYVRRIGYRQAILALQLDGAEGLNLSVGLTVAPIRLEPLIATSTPVEPYDRDEAERPTADWDRAARERWRQETFLESDVRTLSHDEVVESVTLNETDVFRALQRLPGISTRDDWTAELWVRGAPGDLTRTTFDGLPLFNPYHAGGLTSAINSDAIGAVFLHPGVRSPELGAGGAGLVDIKSRSARGLGELRGYASLSSSMLGAAMEKRWLDGRVGTILAGRRSWLGRTRDLVRGAEGVAPEIPNDFVDVVGRVDIDLGNGRALEVSGIWERDWIDGALAGGPVGNRSSWGSLAGRATLQVPLWGGFFRQTAGHSRFTAAVRQIEPRTPLAAFADLPTQEPTDNGVEYAELSGNWTRPSSSGMGPKWRAGYALFHQRVQYRGAPPNPYSVPVYLYTAEIGGKVTALNLWGEYWWRPSDRLVIRLGGRLELDKETVGGLVDDPVVLNNEQLAGQLSLRYALTNRLSVSGAKGSTYQYEQALATSGLLFGPALSVSPLWVLAPGTNSAVRSEITTAGIEYWLNGEWLASANLYDRSTSGIQIPDPEPGSTDDDAFAVQALNKAHGIELAVRRLVGSWTGSLGYALGISDYEAKGLQFPAPSDRRHTVDATIMSKVAEGVVGGTVRVGGTVIAASGAPYTRTHPGLYDCRDYEPGGHCQPILSTSVESPSGERSPWYSGFNVLFDWTRSFTGWRLGAHVQVQNLLNASRAVTYAVDEGLCRRRSVEGPVCGRAEDAFVPGLRRYYELGLRLSF